MNKKDQKIEQICTLGIEAILEHIYRIKEDSSEINAMYILQKVLLERAELAMKMHDIRQDLTKQQTKE